MHRTLRPFPLRATLLTPFLASALAVAMIPATTAAAAVFGRDDRTLLDTSQKPLAESAGTLYATDTGAFCTAFCVAPDKIATASHCLFGTAATPPPRLGKMLFKLGGGIGGKAGIPLAGKTVSNESDHIVAGTRRMEIATPIGAFADWAVARLETPACAGHALPITTMSHAEIEAAASRDQVYQVAAHIDAGDMRLMRGAPCRMSNNPQFSAPAAALATDFQRSERILLHTCDTGGGSSGSPLLINTPKGPEVVAINVGTYVLRRPMTTTGPASPRPPDSPIANTAIEARDIPRAIADLDRNDVISTREDIRKLQRLLREIAFYRGPADGRISERLIESVARFSEASGRGSDPRLRRALFADIPAWTGFATGSIAPRRPAHP